MFSPKSRIGRFLVEIQDRLLIALGGRGRVREMYRTERDAAGLLHAIPARDLITHTASQDCICGPTTSSSGMVLTHHALDGREKWEIS